MNTPTSLDSHPLLQQMANNNRQTGLQKLNDIATFNSRIGNAVAVSGWRNVNLNPEDQSSMVLLYWALVEVANTKHSFNDIVRFWEGMGTKPRQHWVPSGPLEASIISPMPAPGTVLFKKGRTTGVTAWVLVSLPPPAARIRTAPAGLHHRAFLVYPDGFGTHFAREGDSGAWCLNGKGEVVGLVIGGCENDGTSLIIPMESVVKDIERLCGCGDGSVRLQMYSS